MSYKKKVNGREYHSWGDPDEYGISTCNVCGKLMRKKAYVGDSGFVQNTMKWIVYFSEKGSKWTTDHLPCK